MQLNGMQEETQANWWKIDELEYIIQKQAKKGLSNDDMQKKLQEFVIIFPYSQLLNDFIYFRSKTNQFKI
jgi:hypothetical protein